MAHLVGSSQSTCLLQQKLPQIASYTFDSWKAIKWYYNHFQDVIEKESRAISQKLDEYLASLTGRKFRKFSKRYQFTLKKTLEPYHNAFKILNENQELFAGARGEEAVISVLSNLNDDYYIFNDLTLELSHTVFWTKHKEYVKSAQIDHLVIGPSGVFIIETKNWKPNTLRETKFLPHYQIERARLIFELILPRKLNHLTIYCTVVTLGMLPQVDYYGVDQISIRLLTPHILRRTKKLDFKMVEQIVSWIQKNVKR